MTALIKQLTLFEIATSLKGTARKESRLTLLRERRAIYVRRAQWALLKRLLEQPTATADDVRDVVALPSSIDPKLFGAVPGPLVRDGIIESDGFTKTKRPTAHARPITVWRLVNATKARQWLATNPNYPNLVFGDELSSFDANEKQPR